MKKPLIIFIVLVVLIGLGYVGDWAISQPIMSSYDPTAIHWASTHVAGDILYNDASTSDSRSWIVLAKGTAGQFLNMNAGATAPQWSTLTLSTHTSGNYVATLAAGGTSTITVTGSGSEAAAVTIDVANNAIKLAQLDVSDVSDDIAGDIAAGELTDDSVNNDDINWADLTYLTTDGAGIDEAYAAGWNGDVGPPEKDDVYDYLVQFDADADGSFTDESWLTGWVGSASITTLGTITTGTWAVADSIELATATTATNWMTFYSDGSGDVQELANGTNTWILTSQGTGTAPAWVVAPGAAGGDAWSDAVDSDILPTGADNTYDLGSVAASFKDGYFQGTLEAGSLTQGGVAVQTGTDDDVPEAGDFGAATDLDANGAIVANAVALGTDTTGNYVATIADAGNSAITVANSGSEGAAVTLDITASGIEMGTDTSSSNWVAFYGDGSGDVQELANGTTTWVLTSQGTGTAPAWAAGATAWDNIGDPTGTSTIDFITHTQTIDIGKSDSGGGDGLVLDVTGLGAGLDDVKVLKITTSANDDADFVPLYIEDDNAGTPTMQLKIDYSGKIHFRNSGYIYQAGANSIRIGDNSDYFDMNFDSTDIELQWSDGALNLRNNEEGVDAIVEIEGKDAGEKGILRVLSDGDDKWIELYHDDTDSIINSSSGVLKTASLTVTTAFNMASATVTMPKRTSNDEKFYAFNVWNPNAVYADDTQICIEPNLPAVITITEVTVTCDADPTTELDWNLKWADAFIGLANAALVVAIDTTSGTTDVDSGFNDADVAAGKCLYLEFDAEPDSNITQAMVKIRYDFD